MNSIIYLLVALGSLLLAIQNGRNFRTYTATGSFVLLCGLSAVGFGSFGLHLLTAGMFGWIYPIAVALMPAALLGFLVRGLKSKSIRRTISCGDSVSVWCSLLDFKILQSLGSNIGRRYLISVWFFGSCSFGIYWLWNWLQEIGNGTVKFDCNFSRIESLCRSLITRRMDAAVMPDFSLQDITHRERCLLRDRCLSWAPLSMLSLYVLHLMSNSSD